MQVNNNTLKTYEIFWALETEFFKGGCIVIQNKDILNDFVEEKTKREVKRRKSRGRYSEARDFDRSDQK